MPRFRLRIILVLINLVFVSFFYRSYQLVFVSPLPAGVGQKSTVEVRRGTIYDSMGNELAISRETASVGIRPTELLDIKETAQLISPILDIPQSKIIQDLEKNFAKVFFWLKRKINMTTAQNLKKMKIPGVHIRVEPSRYYPNENLASNLIGFVDIDNQGLGGIEFQYNDILTKPGKNSRSGHDIYLTIHSFLQYQLEKHLGKGMENTQSKSAVGIISETNTGRILAMSSLPNFNPQNIQNTIPEQRKNRAVNSIYEPGSTFKIFTLAALIENYLVRPTDSFFCPGYIKKKGFRVRCSRIHHQLNMKEVIKKSCNTGIIDAAEKLPPGGYYKIIKKFGFGKLTEISLSGESRGILHDYNKWDTSLRMSIPIGHGIAVTPVQIIAAANSIANGGRLLRLHVVKKVTTSNGELVFRARPQERNRSISTRASKEVLTYLKLVTEPGGTGSLANLEFSQLKASGKTGTSIKSDFTGYIKDKYQASFLGFFPAEDPKITMFILFDEPSANAYHGGLIAAPVFRKVLRKTFKLIYPGETSRVQKLKQIDLTMNIDEKLTKPNQMPNLLGKSKKAVLRFLSKHYPGEHIIRGHGYVLKQNPLRNAYIRKPYRFILTLGFPR